MCKTQKRSCGWPFAVHWVSLVLHVFYQPKEMSINTNVSEAIFRKWQVHMPASFSASESYTSALQCDGSKLMNIKKGYNNIRSKCTHTNLKIQQM